jgi:hypothetical protein
MGSSRRGSGSQSCSATSRSSQKIDLALPYDSPHARKPESLRKNRVAHALGLSQMLPLASAMEIGR